jgi:uncharacterized Zn finger protein
MMLDYCPVCECDTLHKSVEDDVFEYAIQCMECHTVWEANGTEDE